MSEINCSLLVRDYQFAPRSSKYYKSLVCGGISILIDTTANKFYAIIQLVVDNWSTEYSCHIYVRRTDAC